VLAFGSHARPDKLGTVLLHVRTSKQYNSRGPGGSMS